MMRRLLLASALLLGAADAAAAKKPNFVVLFLDDHGWGDVGANVASVKGLPPVTETPRIDQMAAEGVRFSDFHSAFSVCTASRGALLTGRLCARTGVVSALLLLLVLLLHLLLLLTTTDARRRKTSGHTLSTA